MFAAGGNAARGGYLSVTPPEIRMRCASCTANPLFPDLLDLEMPGLDGFQVMEGLKAFDVGCYLPVLVSRLSPITSCARLKPERRISSANHLIWRKCWCESITCSKPASSSWKQK